MHVRMNRTAGVALAVTVLALLGACSSADPVAGTTPKASGSANAGGSGGDGPDASPAAWPRPCTLVSGAEAAGEKFGGDSVAEIKRNVAGYLDHLVIR